MTIYQSLARLLRGGAREMTIFGSPNRGLAVDPRPRHSQTRWRLSIVWRSASLDDPSLDVDARVRPAADPARGPGHRVGKLFERPRFAGQMMLNRSSRFDP